MLGINTTIKVIAFILFISSTVINATTKLTSGLWGGVDELSQNYNLLEIDEDGEHFFYKLNISSAFRLSKRYEFSNNDISCTNLECTIKIIKSDKENKFLKVSPHLNRMKVLNVLETVTTIEKKYNKSYIYKLLSIDEKSPVRRFIDKYKRNIKNLYTDTSHGINGLWVGVLHTDRSKSLVSMEIYEEKTGNFEQYIEAISVKNQLTIKPENIHLHGDEYEISLDGGLGPYTLILKLSTNDEMIGYIQHDLLRNTPSSLRLKRVKECYGANCE